MYLNFTATPIFNMPALLFPRVGTMPSTGYGASGAKAGDVYIPIHITQLQSANEGAKLTETSYGPVIDLGSNMASGGVAVSYGSTSLAQITLQGFIDTPATLVSQNEYVSKIFVDGNRMTFGEIIGAYFEGRTSENGEGAWKRTLPAWFRDSRGRVYATPLIYDFTAQKIEAVPFRENFTMVLVVT